MLGVLRRGARGQRQWIDKVTHKVDKGIYSYMIASPDSHFVFTRQNGVHLGQGRPPEPALEQHLQGPQDVDFGSD